MARTISLYDAATSRGRLIRQGEIVITNFADLQLAAQKGAG